MKNTQLRDHQHYINLFIRTCKFLSVLLIPYRDNNFFDNGSMWWVNSYDLDFHKKFVELKKTLRLELFKIFGTAIKDPAIDNGLILLELLKVRNKCIDRFRGKYNP